MVLLVASVRVSAARSAWAIITRYFTNLFYIDINICKVGVTSITKIEIALASIVIPLEAGTGTY